MTDDLIIENLNAGEDDVSLYLREIRRYPRLTVEEERDLAQRCSQGDEVAIRRMVNCNLRLVVSIAREYAGRGVPLMDLVQEGSIGLLAAAKKFDPTLEYRFSTYATKWIRQGVTRALMNYALVRVPVHTLERVRKVQQAKKQLLQDTGAEPSVEEIAEKCDIPADKVTKYLNLLPEICSLDTFVGSQEDSTLGDLLENPLAVQPYEKLVREELRNILHGLLATLNERQQHVLRLRFGLEDGIYYSLEQVGEKLGVSKERARQIEHQAMEKLHAAGKEVGLEDFLE